MPDSSAHHSSEPVKMPVTTATASPGPAVRARPSPAKIAAKLRMVAGLASVRPKVVANPASAPGGALAASVATGGAGRRARRPSQIRNAPPISPSGRSISATVAAKLAKPAAASAANSASASAVPRPPAIPARKPPRSVRSMQRAPMGPKGAAMASPIATAVPNRTSISPPDREGRRDHLGQRQDGLAAAEPAAGFQRGEERLHPGQRGQPHLDQIGPGPGDMVAGGDGGIGGGMGAEAGLAGALGQRQPDEGQHWQAKRGGVAVGHHAADRAALGQPPDAFVERGLR
ncbi:hypothetical protein GCM10011341_09090 [Frigidibacter albus]|nr:hypothetical protein GCM10011341_09090 [Frigidibacter albus]